MRTATTQSDSIIWNSLWGLLGSVLQNDPPLHNKRGA